MPCQSQDSPTAYRHKPQDHLWAILFPHLHKARRARVSKADRPCWRRTSQIKPAIPIRGIDPRHKKRPIEKGAGREVVEEGSRSVKHRFGGADKRSAVYEVRTLINALRIGRCGCSCGKDSERMVVNYRLNRIRSGESNTPNQCRVKNIPRLSHRHAMERKSNRYGL